VATSRGRVRSVALQKFPLEQQAVPDPLETSALRTTTAAMLPTADPRRIVIFITDARDIARARCPLHWVLAGPMQMHIAPSPKLATPDHPILAIETTR
jgi:hypothetical protein